MRRARRGRGGQCDIRDKNGRFPSSYPLLYPSRSLSLCLSTFRGWCDTQSQGPERGGCPRRRRRRAEAAAIVVRLFGGGVGREKEQKIAEDKKKDGEEEGERRKKKNCFRTLGHYSLPLPCLFIAFISRKKINSRVE